jgi:L,D-transpeptidase ErfK/SrfK
LGSTIARLAGTSICKAFLLLLLMTTGLASASPYADDIFGANQDYKVNENDSLLEIARKFDVGTNEIVYANPGVDPFVPENGSIVRIPTIWILPEVPVTSGIVINLPEFRLYVFPSNDPGTVSTFPIGIGDLGKDTPIGNYTIIEKIINPAWVVPESILKEKPELPKVVPPGPDNPMGTHALRLSLGTVLIHGTDRPWGIGLRSSHGCLRLYPEDIVRLFKIVDLGTRVTIVNQPVKVAAKDGKVFVEVHKYEDKNYQGQAIKLLRGKKLLTKVDIPKLNRALKEMKGLPVDITR